MGEAESSVVASRKDQEYSGSPAPFALFLVMFVVFVALAILAFPNITSAVFAIMGGGDCVAVWEVSAVGGSWLLL